MSPSRQAKQTTGAKRTPKPRKSDPKKAKKAVPHVDAFMNVMEITALHPGAAGVLAAYGLHCTNCAFNTMDSLDAGARAHGLESDDIQNILTDLRDLLENAPARAAELILTEPAAKALKDLASEQGKPGCLLRVMSDQSGGFCMEFSEEMAPGDHQFAHPAVNGVALIASPETLMRIGGATVDFRDARFKLDLPTVVGCKCDGGNCACKSV